MHFLFRTIFIILALIVPGTMFAATIELRPDLVEHLAKLQRIYPAQAPSTKLGQLPKRVFANKVGVVPGVGYAKPNVIHIKGVIEKGDAKRLEAMLKDWAFFHVGIVLESPGGNFIEGLKMGQAIRDGMSGNEVNLGGVFVLKGTQCLSACALAFAGAVDPYHDAVDTRFIEEGAQLGFHMGILPGEAADRQVRAGDVLFLAYDIVTEYTALIASNRNPPALLQKSLKHRTSDSFYIVEADIDGWSMGFSPVSSGYFAKQIGPSVYDFGLAHKICDTILAYGKTFKTSAEMEFGRFAPAHEQGSGELVSKISATLPLNISTSTEGFSCHFNLDEEGRASAIVWRGDTPCSSGNPTSGGHGWCDSKPKPVWKISNGLLADTLGCPGGKFTPAGQSFFYGRKRQGLIKRDVNMRDDASLNAAVVSQLKAGAKVDITSCKIVEDSQGVWFAVSSAVGSGWTSARFVDEARSLPHSPLDAE